MHANNGSFLRNSRPKQRQQINQGARQRIRLQFLQHTRLSLLWSVFTIYFFGGVDLTGIIYNHKQPILLKWTRIAQVKMILTDSTLWFPALLPLLQVCNLNQYRPSPPKENRNRTLNCQLLTAVGTRKTTTGRCSALLLASAFGSIVGKLSDLRGTTKYSTALLLLPQKIWPMLGTHPATGWALKLTVAQPSRRLSRQTGICLAWISISIVSMVWKSTRLDAWWVALAHLGRGWLYDRLSSSNNGSERRALPMTPLLRMRICDFRKSIEHELSDGPRSTRTPFELSLPPSRTDPLLTQLNATKRLGCGRWWWRSFD